MTGRSVVWQRVFVVVLAVMSSYTALAQSGVPGLQPTAQIRSAIDATNLTGLRDGLSPRIFADRDGGAAADDLPLSDMVLLLKRSPEAQAALDQFTVDQQDPQSAAYHQWLTPEQMGERFGVVAEDLNQITGWLQLQGFHIDSIANSGMLILFSGTHAQLRQAFHTSIHIFRDASGATHYANTTEPSIPAALAPVVQGIASLNNYPLKPMHRIAGAAHRNAVTGEWTVRSAGDKGLPKKENADMRQDLSARPDFSATLGTTKFQAVGPYDFATIYNVLPLWAAGIDGTGQTVAVLAVSDINPKDVDTFRAAFGLPVKPVNMIYVGPNPGIVPDSEEEADLDAQWSGAVARNANIDVVVASDTATTSGLVLGAYDVIDNNLASVLSVSFGDCELGLGNAGNQLYNSLWQQAAAEGITVTIAAGDAGSAACDQGTGEAATYGLTVNGIASTAYNVAVGGTDFYGTYTASATYWSATNNPTTLLSALNYVPEIPWNDSCGNPQYLAALHAHGTALGDTTNEALCNDTGLSVSLSAEQGGGGGGLSNCTNSVYNSVYSFACYNGYPKPYWQTGVLGVPAANTRSLPDISLFAGDGLWGSAYIFCTSDGTPDGVCNYNSSTDLEYLAAGGTSFGTPAFAGIMALVNQKVGTRQGNAGPALYRLAAKQFAVTAPANCDASVAQAGSTCLFQDVSTGTIAEPCVGGSRNCSPVGYYDIYGVLPGYAANAGYDSAVGLGSLNVANVVNAWGALASTYTASATSVAFAQTSLVYGAAATGTVTVTAATGTAIPTGDVSTLSAGYGNGPFTLAGGRVAVSILGLTPGVHSVTAHYAGDATFSASDSAVATITVAQAPSTLSLKPSKTALFGTDTVTLSTTLATTSVSVSPSGSVTFTDTTTGAVLGSAQLQPATDTAGHSIAIGGLNISGHLLTAGSNSIVANYAGDTNYLKAASAPVAISYTGPFTLTASQPTLTLHPNGSGSLTVTVTTTSGPLQQDVFLACPQALPKGLSCVFSPAILPAGSAITTSTFTLYASSTLGSVRTPALPGTRSRRWPLLATTVAGLLLLWLPVKKRRLLAVLPLALVAVWTASLAGCSGSAAPKATKTALTVSAASVAQGSPVTFSSAVTDSNGAPVVAGPVSFYENGNVLGTSNLNTTGVATFTTTTLPAGPHTLTATFGASSAYLSSTSTPVATDVMFSTAIQLTATDSSGNNSSITMPVAVQ